MDPLVTNLFSNDNDSNSKVCANMPTNISNTNENSKCFKTFTASAYTKKIKNKVILLT